MATIKRRRAISVENIQVRFVQADAVVTAEKIKELASLYLKAAAYLGYWSSNPQDPQMPFGSPDKCRLGSGHVLRG